MRLPYRLKACTRELLNPVKFMFKIFLNPNAEKTHLDTLATTCYDDKSMNSSDQTRMARSDSSEHGTEDSDDSDKRRRNADGQQTDVGRREVHNPIIIIIVIIILFKSGNKAHKHKQETYRQTDRQYK